MIYTVLLLLKDVVPSELPQHHVIKALPKAINQAAMHQFACVQISQFYPAGYIHPFEPAHIPPYESFIYIAMRAHDVGYVYIETDHAITSPSHWVASLNYLPEFEDKALFLAACEGAEPVSLMRAFIARNQHDKTNESINHITELYQMALAARYEVDRLVQAYDKTQIISHAKH
ncbi:MAG: hypothetical protein COB41_08700 [Proteobacteria bacterium]|nr:MAG: hypothetical protein COB41_08700 [Pseudomonadota bacterium]